MTMWNKIRIWIGTIPLTIILILFLVVLVFFFRAPVSGFITSLQKGLRRGNGDKKGVAQAEIISEENNSIIPDNPKNYQKVAIESNDATEKILAMLDETLEALKNAKVNH